MEQFTLVLLAVGLSMDAFAVSVSDGMCYRGLKKRQAFMIAGMFGFFQALMPVIGFFLGQTFSKAISFIDHWVAFGLLALIGGHMLLEAVKDLKNPKEECDLEVCSFKKVFIQGIATSIDALAVGVSFAITDTNIFFAASTIGIITFVCCIIGVAAGKKAGKLLSGKAEIIGGVILIGIGLKIVIEHLFFS